MVRSAFMVFSIVAACALAPPEATAFSAQVAQDVQGMTDKQRYALTETLLRQSDGFWDEQVAFAQMRRLAEGGYGRAQARLAY